MKRGDIVVVTDKLSKNFAKLGIVRVVFPRKVHVKFEFSDMRYEYKITSVKSANLAKIELI